MYIVIAGCGRMGSILARNFSSEGNDVVIIDNENNNLDRLGSGFNGQRIRGVEYDIDILRDAGLEHADIFLAMTADDNINITAAQIARKIFNVPRVISRVCEPNKEYIYKKLGIETVTPTQLGVNLVKNKIEKIVV